MFHYKSQRKEVGAVAVAEAVDASFFFFPRAEAASIRCGSTTLIKIFLCLKEYVSI
jgi:hypothetical protein